MFYRVWSKTKRAHFILNWSEFEQLLFGHYYSVQYPERKLSQFIILCGFIYKRKFFPPIFEIIRKIVFPVFNASRLGDTVFIENFIVAFAAHFS